MKKNLSEKENLLLVYEGKQPEWVPINEKSTNGCMLSSIVGWALFDKAPYKEVYDVFGTSYSYGPDVNVAPMPTPGKIHVPDITRWKEFIKLPLMDLKSLDWEQEAARDTRHWDRENKLSCVMMGGSCSGVPFNAMVSFLGHEGAYVAMMEEEDAWHELIGLITDWNVELCKYVIKYYKPDTICLSDDCASAFGPMMSLPMYRKLIKPYQKKLADAVLEEGCILDVHCCGRADAFVDDWVEMGVRSWNPAQVYNDLEGIKARYGNRFVICGAWDSSGAPALPGASEEMVRAAVRKSIDRLAAGGGYVFSVCGMTDPAFVGEEHFGWIMDEAEKYGYEFYH